MDRDERMKDLHDRFTRGDSLSESERAELHAWYDEQDQAEAALLARSSERPMTVTLDEQIRAGAQQVRVVARHIEQLVAENEQLRREIGELQRRLVETGAAHRA